MNAAGYCPTEAHYQRQNDASRRQSDQDESYGLLLLIFLVIPLLGFSLLIIFIYRRVTSNRTTYRGTAAVHISFVQKNCSLH